MARESAAQAAVSAAFGPDVHALEKLDPSVVRDGGYLELVSPKPTASVPDVPRAADTESVIANRVAERVVARSAPRICTTCPSLARISAGPSPVIGRRSVVPLRSVREHREGGNGQGRGQQKSHQRKAGAVVDLDQPARSGAMSVAPEPLRQIGQHLPPRPAICCGRARLPATALIATFPSNAR